jgi:hypothetical protein
MTYQNFGVFIPGRRTAEKVYESRRAAENQAATWEEKFSPSFNVCETNPSNPEVRLEECDPAVDENSDETNDDSEPNTTMDYNFVSNGQQNSDNNQTNDFSTVGNKWTLGNHTSVSSSDKEKLSWSLQDTMAALDENVDDDLLSVLEDASSLVDSTSISRFECPLEACGLGHSHGDHKHDIRSGFNVTDSFADQMKFCPYCHCGVNELSMLVAFFPYITEPVFADQHEFEEVLEVEPGVLNEMYRLYNEEGSSVSAAAGTVAARRGGVESEMIPLGTREAIKTFFRRRQRIEEAANAAPIPQETRYEIETARNGVEESIDE